MPWWWMVGFLVACGRFGFDAHPTDATADDATPVDEDLLVWLPFDDDPTANRGVLGSTVTCATDCPPAAAGARDGAYDFTTHVLTIPDQIELHLTEGTLAVWVAPRTLPPTDGYRFIAGTAYGPGGLNTWELFIYTDENTGIPRIQGGGDASGGLYSDTTWSYGLDTWIHLAFVWDTSGSRLYVNGAQVATGAAFTPLYDGHAITIGADDELGVPMNYFDGRLDDLRIYRRPLSVAEVLSLGQ